MMNIVITMAGLGKRFKAAGYVLPKYMITVKEKTLFEWSLQSLEAFHKIQAVYYFVVRKEDNAAYFIKSVCKKLKILHYEVIELQELTKGQAETVMMAQDNWQEEEPLLIYNIDTYIEAGVIQPDELHGDGYIPCFKGNGDHWSFVRLDKHGKAVEIREKKRISEFCTVGAYYFKTAKLFKELYTSLYIKNNYLEAGEQYIAPMYNYLLKIGGNVYISDIPTDKVHVLGTPEEVAQFSQTS